MGIWDYWKHTYKPKENTSSEKVWEGLETLVGMISEVQPVVKDRKRLLFYFVLNI